MPAGHVPGAAAAATAGAWVDHDTVTFFSPRFDSHERRFPYYQRVVRFVGDVHNYTAWRGAFDPRLTRLLQQMCR